MKKIFYFFIWMSFFACNESSSFESKPKDLIDASIMKLILKEMILMESYLQTTIPNIEAVQKSMKLNGEEILNKHKVTLQQYEHSMEYYAAHQEQLNEIYTSLIEGLNIEKVKTE